MQLQLVTIADSMRRLADRCEKAKRGETISILTEAYHLLHPEDHAASRILEQLISTLAFTEAAIILIPPSCAEALDWSFNEDSAKEIAFNVYINLVEDGPEGDPLGFCRSPYRAIAYVGAAMRAHAHLLEEQDD